MNQIQLRFTQRKEDPAAAPRAGSRLGLSGDDYPAAPKSARVTGRSRGTQPAPPVETVSAIAAVMMSAWSLRQSGPRDDG